MCYSLGMTNTESMSKGPGRGLAWTGMIGGGALSLAANVRSLWIPEYTEAVDWHSLPTPDVSDPGAIVAAVALPIIAAAGVEMVNKWTHLHKALRFGVVGFVAACAMVASFAHIMTVLMWYGQPVPLAILMTIAVDGVMILSGLALFTKPRPSGQPDTAPAPDTDTDTDMSEPDNEADSLPDTLDTDTWTDPDNYVPDTWTPDSVDTPDETAPVDIVDTIPAPRRTAVRTASKAWTDTALAALEQGYSPSEIARMILEKEPGTWSTHEAGRKAVSRLA